ncbi:MAG: hypothetical protein AABY07_00515 [Nanoarchaeota archaeon]
MKITDFDMSFRDDILEMVKAGVIKLDKDGTILKTSFGKNVHTYMKRKGMLSENKDSE